ncbi:protoglobin domain-containing protein [Ancylobacter sp. MQZ15Z-1]|uniref:Protoglobin domain-containing protein n=1 Tax=Ancylobacter mangrovi TaxID=2972472 RepID=A0A9X2P855_9HYPH|nr:HD domain-containing phosphohydrolase [Ancylobacter mangrovi]MCS0493859.1 protoglobin domain-containing protein [Ancylobacter mangrovi]
MPRSLARWIALLNIDEATTATLRAMAPLIKAHGDEVIGAALSPLTAPGPAPIAFAEPASIERAREAMRRHWLDYVFAGRFDGEYLAAARALGTVHFRLGIDPLQFSATYSLLVSGIVDLVCRHFAGDVQRQSSNIAAINRVAFLDLGLASAVYYDACLGEIDDLTYELNMSLARVGEYRDYEGGHHLIRVSRMCHALALAAGQSPAWANALQMASPLHDIGKIGVPDDILLKPAPLTEAERMVMQRHTEIGAEIIPDHPSPVIHMARLVALRHHERWDGRGYPGGLRGEDIPLEARIVAICDVYDALLASRPYKKAWSRKSARDYIAANRGIMFDPRLVDVFLLIQPSMERIQDAFADPESDISPATVPDMLRAMRSEFRPLREPPRVALPAREMRAP